MYFDNFALESLYKNAIKNKVLISGGGMEAKIYGYNQTFSKYILFNNDGIMNYTNYQYDFYYQRFIYNKNFVKKNKIFFPDLRRFQDPPFFIKVMFMAKNFYTLKNITYVYRSKTDYNSLNKRQVIDMFYGLEECLQFAEKKKLYKLYNILLNRLNSHFFWDRTKQFFEDVDLKSIVNKIIRSINKEKIKKYNLVFNLSDLFNNYKYY